MQISADPANPRFIPIVWYFAPKGAKLFTGVNAFCPGDQDRDQPLETFAIGEQRPYSAPFYHGQNLWGYKGQCRIGSDDAFAYGLSAEELSAPVASIPFCCAIPPERLGVRIGFPEPLRVYRVVLGIALDVGPAPEVFPAVLGIALDVGPAPEVFAAALGIALDVGPAPEVFAAALGIALEVGPVYWVSRASRVCSCSTATSRNNGNQFQRSTVCSCSAASSTITCTVSVSSTVCSCSQASGDGYNNSVRKSTVCSCSAASSTHS